LAKIEGRRGNWKKEEQIFPNVARKKKLWGRGEGAGNANIEVCGN